MEVKEYQEGDFDRLFEYWKKVGADIPYFFPVSAQKWRACLFEDELEDERIFKSLETYLAVENDRVLGFTQYGQPNFAWDKNGQKYYDPHIGVIRHLYFEKERGDVGKALLVRANDALAGFDRNYAFYHIFGMSCNAHHGKLHSSQVHIERILLAHGFQTGHENPYYVLDMGCIAPSENPRLHLGTNNELGRREFEIRLNTEVVGTAQVRYLDTLTGGYTHDTAYLAWIAVAERHQGEGIGTEFMKLLVQILLGKGYRYLHTDTASDNIRAQKFYEKLGFQQAGYTRDYVQVKSSGVTLGFLE